MPFPKRIDPVTLGERGLQVVESRGWDHWSLREVAAAVGVSANALYRHVDGKDGLLIAIGEAAARELYAVLLSVPGSGEERWIGFARAYVTFSMERPHAFSAFVHAKPGPDDPRIGIWFEMWSMFCGMVRSQLPDSAPAAAFAYWALIHGRAELARGPARLAAPTAGLDDAVRALMRGYALLGVVDNPLPPHVPVD